MPIMPDVLALLKQHGALITNDHLVYTSGKHGSVYINKDALYPHTEAASRIGLMMAERHKEQQIDVVVGPALGGIILSQWTAHHLSALGKKNILAVYAEKDKEKNLIFTRGYDALIQNKNILVVEDITNTGGSTKKVITAVERAGGSVVAACVMVNRDPQKITSETMGVPFSALEVLQADAYDLEECPLCAQGIPINTQVGHGRAFMQQQT